MNSDVVLQLAVNEELDTLVSWSRDGSLGFHALAKPRCLHHVLPPEGLSIVQVSQGRGGGSGKQLVVGRLPCYDGTEGAGSRFHSLKM
jgi:hypothetical protein